MSLDAMTFPDGYPELLEQIGQAVYRKLLAFQLDPHLASSWAFHITEAIRADVGGVQQYIPRGISYELSIRDQKIWAEFHGDNYNTLARKYKLTEMQVRNIIKRAREREALNRQYRLLD